MVEPNKISRVNLSKLNLSFRIEGGIFLSFLALLRNDDRLKREAHDQKGQRSPTNDVSIPPQWDGIVGSRRVTWSGECQQDQQQNVRVHFHLNHCSNGRQNQSPCNPVSPAADECVHDVTAVQLANRKQIHGRNEHSHPPSGCISIPVKDHAGSGRTMYRFNDPAHDERLAKLETSLR